MSSPGRQHWNDALPAFWSQGGGGIWRRYCDQLHGGLLASFLGNQRFSRGLKTDLFDEAAGDGLVGDLQNYARSVLALDLSPVVAGEAARRRAPHDFFASDIRHIPLPDGSVDLVFSNSTLDHFPRREDIEESLREIWRVLAPGGHLLVTFDNPENPILWLRQALPFRVLHALGLVPYYVGASFGARTLAAALAAAGFAVVRQGAMMHIPRVLAIPLCAALDRWRPQAGPGWIRFLLRGESLERTPFRRFTGHYVTALAIKPLAPPER